MININKRSIENVVVEGCIVSSSKGEGIFAGGCCGTVTIRRCMVRDNEQDGFLVQESGASNVKAVVESSIFRGNSGNGFTWNSASVFYYNTLFDKGTFGMSLAVYPGSVTATNNLFHSGSAVLSGIVEMENNYFTEHSGSIVGIDSAAYTEASSFNSG